jgi:hypothetical protein
MLLLLLFWSVFVLLDSIYSCSSSSKGEFDVVRVAQFIATNSRRRPAKVPLYF